MATGDLKGSLRKLQTCLRSVRYPTDVDYQGLAKGDPSSCLPIVSYTFCSFSSAVAELLVGHGVELTGKNDLSFIESVYKVLRDLFGYKPLLTKQQFLQSGFAERKVSLLCDVIGLVLEKRKQLAAGTKPASPPRRRTPCRSDSKTAQQCSPPKERPRAASQRVVRSKPLVERHPSRGTPARDGLRPDGKHHEGNGIGVDKEKGRSPPHAAPHPAAHTECVSGSSLRAVEAGLQECVCRLQQKLGVLDARVQALEENTAGKICIELSDWQELQNRVLLLETGLELSRHATDAGRSTERRQRSGETAPEAPSSGEEAAACVPSSSRENIKERLERIACMMKDTSSLLTNAEPSL